MFSSGLRTLWLLTFMAPCSLVGHVAVGAAHAAPGVDALAPQFELRVLGLVDQGARLAVLVVVERSCRRGSCARRRSASICSTFRPLSQGKKSVSLEAQ